jgi:hypothetical protein
MKKVTFVTFFLSLLLACQFIYAADEINIYQYYPSPSGNFDELKVGRIEGKPKTQAEINAGGCSGAPAGQEARCYSRHNDSGVEPNDRVVGFNADYVDGYSSEEFFMATSKRGNCYCLPIIEIPSIEVGGVDVTLGGSGCLLRNTYMQDMLWNGSADTIPEIGLTFRGIIKCCRMSFLNGQCSIDAGDKVAQWVACNYCNFINKFDVSNTNLVTWIGQNIPCFEADIAVLQQECAQCNYTTATTSCNDIFNPTIAF